MLRVLEFITLIGLIGFIVFFIYGKIHNKKKIRALALDEMAKALRADSKKELENVIILHGKHLDKDIKKAVNVRIAELTIEEDYINDTRKMYNLER